MRGHFIKQSVDDEIPFFERRFHEKYIAEGKKHGFVSFHEEQINNRE
jgi:hypothetical protein